MSEFKVGDKVRRVGGLWGKMRTGDIDTVKRITPYGSVILEEFDGVHSLSSLELVEESNLTPHFHCEMIKAWADGHTIQHTTVNIEGWEDVLYPNWDSSVLYRIKPDKPTKENLLNCINGLNTIANLKGVSWPTPSEIQAIAELIKEKYE